MEASSAVRGRREPPLSNFIQLTKRSTTHRHLGTTIQHLETKGNKRMGMKAVSKKICGMEIEDNNQGDTQTCNTVALHVIFIKVKATQATGNKDMDTSSVQYIVDPGRSNV